MRTGVFYIPAEPAASAVYALIATDALSPPPTTLLSRLLKLSGRSGKQFFPVPPDERQMATGRNCGEFGIRIQAERPAVVGSQMPTDSPNDKRPPQMVLHLRRSDQNLKEILRMAKSNIAQASNDVKQEIPPISSVLSCGDTDYLIGLSAVDCDLNDYRVSGVLRGDMVRQIMTGPNDLALATLSSVGPIGFVPGIGDNSIPLNEIAAFYSVTEKYLRSMLSRTGFTEKQYPQDVRRLHLYDIRNAKAPIEPCCVSMQKDANNLITYRVAGAYCQMKVSLPKTNYAFNLYSPRFVLALGLMMVYTDKSPMEGNIKKTLLALKRGPYRFVRKEGKHMTGSDDRVQITANGDIKLSPEILARSLKAAIREGLSDELPQAVSAMGSSAKSAVKEAVFEVMTEFYASAAQEKRAAADGTAANKPRKCPNKLRRPDNWDGIVAAWRDGKLSAEQAADMAGMSLSSFRGYAAGKKTFD